MLTSEEREQVNLLARDRTRRRTFLVQGSIKAEPGKLPPPVYVADGSQASIPEEDAKPKEELNWLQRQRAETDRIKEQLKALGLAGVLSYGLFNTCYYLFAFLFVWFKVVPSPGGLGLRPAAERFVKVFAMTWAGSQVTKVFRALGALALAPFVEKGLTYFTRRFNFKSRSQAFGAIVGGCITLALLVFGIIVSLWA